MAPGKFSWAFLFGFANILLTLQAQLFHECCFHRCLELGRRCFLDSGEATAVQVERYDNRRMAQLHTGFQRDVGNLNVALVSVCAVHDNLSVERHVI